MNRGTFSRRLSVIFYADVVAYSRLTASDEDETYRQLRDRLDVIAKQVSDHNGRVVNYAGDAALATFEAASDAVNCAAAIQGAFAAEDSMVDEPRRMRFRIGINLGDIIEDRADVFGDDVNIAARLEGIAPEGGICVSQSVRDAVGRNLPYRFLNIGAQKLKNIDDPVNAFVVDFIDVDRKRQSALGLEDQTPVRYCAAVDGISLAYSEVGEGYPLAVAGAWITHLEREWDDPGWRNYLQGLAQSFRLIRYDQRGNGMSDWDGVEISFERMVADLGTIVDRSGRDRVAIWGSSQGAAVAATYAAMHPDRVSRLILYGGYARGRRRRGDPEATAESEALVTLIRQSWGRDNPVIRQAVTSLFMPDATAEEQAWFNNFQRDCGPAGNIAQFREVFDSIDITNVLEKIACPTLVIHCVGDAVAPLAEGRLLASRIPNADFVSLKSDSHMMTERDPEFPKMLEAVRQFMDPVTSGVAPSA